MKVSLDGYIKHSVQNFSFKNAAELTTRLNGVSFGRIALRHTHKPFPVPAHVLLSVNVSPPSSLRANLAMFSSGKIGGRVL